MEIIALLIVISLFLSLIGFFIKTKGIISIFKICLPFFSLLLIIVNLIIGRHSWQIVPLYLLVLILILISVTKIKQNSKTYNIEKIYLLFKWARKIKSIGLFFCDNN